MSFGGWNSNNSGGFGSFGSNTGFGSSNTGGFGSNSGGFGGFGSSNNNNNNNTRFGSNNNNNNNNNNNGGGGQLGPNTVSFIPNNNSDHNVNKDGMVDLRICPTDAITCLSCSPQNNIFSCGSWDGKCYIYQYNPNNGQCQGMLSPNHDNNRGVLCLTYNPKGDQIFTGGCDYNIKITSLNGGKTITLGNHNSSVSCMKYWNNKNVLISGSWDGTLKFWDMRNAQAVGTVNTGYKIYCMALQGDRLMVGVNSNESVQIYNLNNYNGGNNLQPSLRKKTALNHQIRCIDMMPSGKGFAVSGVEGRCAIEYWNPRNKQTNFSFKCHRHPRKQQYNNHPTDNDVFSVNSVRFHKFGGFATVGDDGAINTWDEKNRTRLKQFGRLPLPVVDVDFTWGNGDIMVYATSYTWAYGSMQYNKDAQKPRIYLHKVDRWEVDPDTKNPNQNNN